MTGTRESMIPVKNFMAMLGAFGVFQIIFLFQLNYAGFHQLPATCDCQCTKQLHFNTNGELTAEGVDREPAKPKKIFTADEEKKFKRILEAEDKRLDREHRKLNKTVDEDPEGPYQAENINKKEKSPANKLVWNELNLNPLLNDSALRCTGDHSNLIFIYVYSAPSHTHERNRIRRTWGSVKEYQNKQISVAFFIGGLVGKNEKAWPSILNESKAHGDIVHDTSYVDAYRNLTLKGISALQWVNRYCPKAYRIMKVDDDTIVNPYQLIKFLRGQSEITMAEIICKVTTGVGPIRNPHSKYYVSYQEYSDSRYPSYCQGYGYIYPPSAVPQILNALPNVKPIAMEDVYLTGLTAKTKAIRTHTLTAMFATTFSRFETFLERITSRPDLIIIGHVHEDRYVDVFWQLVQQRRENENRFPQSSN